MRWVKISFLVCLTLLATLSCSSSTTTNSGVQVELVNLQTADDVWLSGALRRPLSTQTRAAVVMVHGYGGNFYSGIMDFLPEALAARGFATLALNMRDHDLGPKKNLFEENLQDIAKGVDEMARRNHKPLFLYGHSMGTNRVLYYQAETIDPRITGIILTSPPGNLFQWNARIFGQNAASRVLYRAQELKADSKGDTWMLINLGPLGKALYTANHVVSLRGPETHSDPFTNIARVSKPVLVVHGLADRLAVPDVADQLQKSARAETQVMVSKIDGAGHLFREHQQALVEVICQWLLEQLGQ